MSSILLAVHLLLITNRRNTNDAFPPYSVLLKMAREASGRTQEEIAQIIGTQKSAISRIENHAEDIRLSTLEKFAKSVGRKLEVRLV